MNSVKQPLQLTPVRAWCDVAESSTQAAPRLIPTIQTVLATSEAATQKIVLRTVGFLAIKDDAFKMQLLTKPFLERPVKRFSNSFPFSFEVKRFCNSFLFLLRLISSPSSEVKHLSR
jgi:hypothetical protein